MSQQPSSIESNRYVIIFITVLSLICAVILSILASALAPAQDRARELDRSEQMMIAAKLLSIKGYFLLENEEGSYVPAKYTDEGLLVPGTAEDIATSTQILALFNKRIKPMLVTKEGELTTFEKEGLNVQSYVTDFQKAGYYKQPLMLIYVVEPNQTEPGKPIAYVIPVNGFGLWDAIYGYLAIKPDGDTVIGTTWYDQKETPGLGANISEWDWQEQFLGKLIFQQSPNGTTDLKSAPLGITVVKGKVSEVYADTPKAKSAVDGMPGATLTGTGVTLAYKDVLAPYRPFLIKINKESEAANKGGSAHE